MRIAEHEQIPVREGVPDGKHYVTCTHDCPDACSVELTVQAGKVSEIGGDPEHAMTRGYLCEKTPLEIVKSHGAASRLRHPLRRREDGEFEQISWDEAFALVAGKIEEYRSRYGPSAILHYHGAGAFGGLKRTFTRRFFSLLGASTISGSICDSAGMAGQALDFGDQRTHDPQDMRNSRFVVVWGRNPANTNPHFMEFMKDARKSGVEVVLIDPIRTRTARICSEHLPIRPGTDKWLALALGRVILEEGWVDTAFLAQHTVGFDEYRRLAMSVDVASAAATCGVGAEEIRRLARRYATTRPSSIWLGFGVQRYLDGGETFRAIDALGALTGNIGVPGGGVSHQNSEVRKYFDYGTNLEDGSARRRSLRKAAIAEDLERAVDPPVRMIFVTTVNPVAQCPNALRVKAAFERTEFVVVADSTLTDTARCAHVVLPTTRFLEEDDVAWGYGNHYLGLARGLLRAPGEAKSDFEIIQTLARRLGFSEEMDGTVRQWIDRTLAPVAWKGIDHDGLARGQVTNPNLDPVAFRDRRFTTPSGKFDFVRRVRPPPPEDREFPYPFLTVHHHLWLNSNVFTDKQRAELGSPPFAFLHPTTADALQVRDGDRVVLGSRVGEMVAQVRISDRYPAETVTMYQGGSVAEGTCANLITDDALVSEHGEMAAYYSTRIRVRRT